MIRLDKDDTNPKIRESLPIAQQERTTGSHEQGDELAPTKTDGSLGTKSRTRRLLSVVNQRVKGAAVKGLVVATLIGMAIAGVMTGDVGPSTAANFDQAPPAAVQRVKQAPTTPSSTIPEAIAKGLAESLEKTRGVANHTWRDAAPVNADGTINAYVEINRGNRTKWEYVIDSNSLEVDRMLHDSLDGYPCNYGFLPGSFGFDGDPFDVLVLGPEIEGGETVKGVIVGIMHMDDEKGPDPKVVISPVGDDGQPLYRLTDEVRSDFTEWFDAYKVPDAHKGKWSKVTGWGDAAEGKQYVEITTGYFDQGLEADPTLKPIDSDSKGG